MGCTHVLRANKVSYNFYFQVIKCITFKFVNNFENKINQDRLVLLQLNSYKTSNWNQKFGNKFIESGKEYCTLNSIYAVNTNAQVWA